MLIAVSGAFFSYSKPLSASTQATRICFMLLDSHHVEETVLWT